MESPGSASLHERDSVEQRATATSWDLLRVRCRFVIVCARSVAAALGTGPLCRVSTPAPFSPDVEVRSERLNVHATRDAEGTGAKAGVSDGGSRHARIRRQVAAISRAARNVLSSNATANPDRPISRATPTCQVLTKRRWAPGRLFALLRASAWW